MWKRWYKSTWKILAIKCMAAVSGNSNLNLKFSAIYVTVFSVMKLWFRSNKCTNQYKRIFKLIIGMFPFLRKVWVKLEWKWCIGTKIQWVLYMFVYTFQKPLWFSFWAICGISLGVGVFISALLFITVFINKLCMTQMSFFSLYSCSLIS